MLRLIDVEKIENQVNVHIFTKTIVSHKWLAFFYGIFLFLYELKFLRENISAIHLVLIAWAGLVVVYDLFVRKIWRKVPHWKYLAVFSVCAAVTVLVNLETGLVTNVKSWVMVVLPLLAFYPVCMEGNRQQRNKTILTVLSGSAVVVFVASTFAVWMYLQRYYEEVTFLGIDDFVGVLFLKVDEALTTTLLYGIYVDTNHAAMYSLLFTAYSFMLLDAYFRGYCGKKWQKILGSVFAVVNIIVQVCFFPLANSRGAWLSLLVALFLAGVLYVYFHCENRIRPILARMVTSGLCMVIFVAFVYSGLMHLRTGISQFSVWLNTESSVQNPSLESEPEGTDPKPTVPPISDMESDSFEKLDNGTGSGRLVIWKDALELFLKKPLFGTGPGNNQYYAIKFGVAQDKIANGTDVHNSYLDLLVDYGLFGAVPMVAFWVMCAFTVLKRIFKTGKECGLFYYLNVLCVLMVSGAAALLSCVFVSTTAMYYIMLLMTGYLVAGSASEREKESAV